MEIGDTIGEYMVWGGRIAGPGMVSIELGAADGSGRSAGHILVDEAQASGIVYRAVLELKVKALPTPTEPGT